MSIIERGSPSYARGWRDCRDRRPKLYEDDGTFVGHDYHEGWSAYWNEQYWTAVRENEARQ